jgi:carboxyl-terminal processing protease
LQADFRARHKAIDGATGKDDDNDQDTADDGLQANERSLKYDLEHEKDAKKAKDPFLDEAAHIVGDEVDLIKADPKLAAEVLPYQGKGGLAQADAAAPMQ